jgi:hypothetical protein
VVSGLAPPWTSKTSGPTPSRITATAFIATTVEKHPGWLWFRFAFEYRKRRR